MKPDPMTKQEYSVNRRVGTFFVPTRALFASAWAQKHAHPTPVNFYTIVQADSRQAKYTLQEGKRETKLMALKKEMKGYFQEFSYAS